MAKYNLSALETGVLTLSPFAKPQNWNGAEQRAAHKLVKLGLLERAPDSPNQFRRTQQGTNVAEKLFLGEDV